MGKYDVNLIDKMKADVEIPKVVDAKLEEAYGRICLGEVEMKDGVLPDVPIDRKSVV